ncbi:MAG: two-component system phosphate regulon sensor histidine kinase PhoR [Cryomorphaceae bacterium]|jgi:two-component system phosphate regulon sensor histidine kinase PhoR
MTGRSPFRVAILTALSLALSITVLLVGTLLLFREEIDLVQVLVFAALVFLSSWLIIYKSLQRFIYDKIKLIFRNMHSLKVGRSAFRLDMSKDVLGDVNKEVVDWAEDRMAEIEDLREKENFRKEFVGNLAHELKTPIFSIQGYILTLLEGALEDPNFNRKFLMKAAKSVDRMTMLVEDLDTITQFESGSLKLDKEKIDIVELTKEVIEQREEEAKQKNIDIRFNKPYDKPIYVGADSFRVSQVLINLITNSINYGKIGGKTTVRFFDMDERILIEVEDNGPGIDKEHIPRLFERFYRVDKSRSRHQGGTGLGLAICKHIIEGHEQSMNVRSEVGKGSVFSFTLAKS